MEYLAWDLRRRRDIDEVINALSGRENLDPASFSLLWIAKLNG